MKVTPEWQPHTMLLAMCPIWAGWFIGQTICEEVTKLIQRSKYEETIRPIYPMLIHGVVLTANLVAGFVILLLAQDTDGVTEIDISAGMLALAIFIPHPLVVGGLYVYQIPITTPNEGFTGWVVLSKHKYLVLSSFLLSGGISLMYTFANLGIKYYTTDTTILPGIAMLGLFLMWGFLYVAQAAMLHIPRKACTVLATGLSVLGTVLYCVVMKESVEIDVRHKYPYSGGDGAALWWSYLHINLFVGLAAIVNSASLMVTSLMVNSSLQNSYCLGLSLGISLGLGLNVDTSSTTQALSLSLSLTLLISYTTLLSGIGNRIPYGISTGLPYATALYLNKGSPYAQLTTGVGLAVAMVLVQEVCVVFTLQIYKMVFTTQSEVPAGQVLERDSKEERKKK